MQEGCFTLIVYFSLFVHDFKEILINKFLSQGRGWGGGFSLQTHVFQLPHCTLRTSALKDNGKDLNYRVPFDI